MTTWAAISFSITFTERRDPVATLLLRILGIPGSNPDQESSYPELFRGFHQSLQTNVQIVH
jgi:hypothetical protein